MINDIRYHVSDDEELQTGLEEKLAAHMSITHQKNINAFQRNIPTLLPVVSSIQQKNIAVFCNKAGEYNLVDIGLGKVLYGPDPKSEIKSHVEFFQQKPFHVSFENDSDDESPNSWDCVVVFGCGIGYHILELLKQQSIRYLIVYEPEVQYFTASTRILDWKQIFDLAKENETSIFLQIGKDGRDLVSDLTELKSAVNLTGFYAYKHYNHLVFDQVMLSLSTLTWQDIDKHGLKLDLTQKSNEYVLPWNEPLAPDSLKEENLNDATKSKNLDAFKRFFPEIYQHFKDYEPVIWRPIGNAQGQVNMLRITDEVPWYGPSPLNEADQHLKFFAKHPHKDGLILSYNGDKLLHYEHYKFVKKTEKLLEEATEGEQNLPDTIPSIIIFGLGCGYSLEKLLEQHTVEKLFLVEPNRDFFYASLYAVDWASLLEEFDASEKRIYMNIGDDGSHLINDLMNQFTSVGPYLLNQTYFFQGYYNALMNEAIANLREQLRIMICMGEYFDHAFYGINHTDAAIANKAKLLTANYSQCLNLIDKETPVFVIGNGPSIDTSIEVLKEYREQAILISCGTALKVLYRNGITPDFHAEIEQNRTTFDWASLIDAPEYLSEISLLSCNGIHPDTMELYKDTYLAFKKGESSTVVSQDIFGQNTFAELEYGFPTVANLVVDFVTTLGFSTAYLFGIDLGFIDPKNHHSKASDYYMADGEELYDYSEHNQTALVVPGNFRKSVFTKYEFKLSKRLMEQRIGLGKTTFYNCSDGAKIYGSTPLNYQDILLTNSIEEQRTCLDHLKNQCFVFPDNEMYRTRRQQKFSIDNTLNDFEQLEAAITDCTLESDKIESLAEKLKNINFSSYKRQNSLFFYYMYGSVNFFSAALAKIRAIPSEEGRHSSTMKHISDWRESLASIKRIIKSSYYNYDNSSFQTGSIEQIKVAQLIKGRKILLASNESLLLRGFRFNCEKLDTYITTVSSCDYQAQELAEFDYKIIHFNSAELNSTANQNLLQKVHDNGRDKTLIVAIDLNDSDEVTHMLSQYQNISFFLFFNDTQLGENWISHRLYFSYILLRAMLNEHDEHLIISKIVAGEKLEQDEIPDIGNLYDAENLEGFDFGTYLCFREKQEEFPRLLLPLGTRAKDIKKDFSDLILSRNSAADLALEINVAKEILER